jgi:hypothetical protein
MNIYIKPGFIKKHSRLSGIAFLYSNKGQIKEKP